MVPATSPAGASPALTPLALENADLLRRLQAQDFDSKTALADSLGRDRSNLNKTLKALEAEGLVLALSARLTDAGANAVRLLARLDGAEGPPAAAGEGARLPEGFASLAWIQIEPDPLNPRKHFDEEALEELAASIARDGLLENLVVRPGVVPDDPIVLLGGQPAPIHRLVAGERRWRAIGRLIETGRWDRTRAIVCKVADIDDAAHRRIALVENLQRKDLKPLEESRAIRELMDATGAGTAEIAAEIGFTQRWVQQRLQLLELPAIKQLELTEGRIKVEDARRWLADRPKPLQLGATQALVLMEVAWAISAIKGADRHARVPVDYRRPRQPPEASPGAPLIHFDRDHMGRETVRLGNAGWNHLCGLAGSQELALRRDGLDAHVRQARLAMMPADLDAKAKADEIDELFKSKRFVTAWLNPPFRIDPEWTAEERRREAEAERHRREQERRRNEEEQARREREAIDAANSAREDRMRRAVAIFERRVSEGGDVKDAAEALMSTLGYQAPFSVAWDGRQVVLQDAAGTHWSGSAQLLEGLRRIMALAMNHMLGCPMTSGDELVGTPWAQRAREEAEDSEALDRAAYVGRIADLLLERDDIDERILAIDAAERALAAFLARHGLEFAAEGEDWELILDDVYEDAIALAEAGDRELAE